MATYLASEHEFHSLFDRKQGGIRQCIQLSVSDYTKKGDTSL